MGGMRGARMGGMAALYSSLVLAGAAMLAVLAARHPVRFDLTRGSTSSLSAETRRIIASIPDAGPPVEILAVTSLAAGGGSSAEAERQVRPLLELLERESPLRLKTRLIFAESEPALVKGLGVESTPMIIVAWAPPAAEGAPPVVESAPSAGGGAPPAGTGPAAPEGAEPQRAPVRERRTALLTEDGIARALAECIEGKRHQAYLLAGHGEMRPDDASPAGLAALAALLEGLNYELHELLLAGAAVIPADADLLIIAGAEADLMPDEVQSLRGFAERGGRILVLHGPARAAGSFPSLEGWLRSDWGVGSVDGVVADLDAPLAGNHVTLLVRPDASDTHPIVNGFSKLIEIPASRKLAAEPYPADGVTPAVLVQSGPRSWLETDLTTRSPEFDATDLRGPHSLAMASTRKPPTPQPPPEARLVVLGSRLLASNLFLGEVGNADFLRNVISWLAGRENDIARRSGSGQDGSVVIERSQGLLILVFTLAIPLIVAAFGLATWWWRRRL